jgi:regulator of sigma E protease
MFLTALLVIIVFSLLVFVHELGHFLVARRNGVTVEEFGFGFPPRLVGKRVGNTIYSINAIPLGGFVRLAGEDSADKRPHTFGAATTWVKTKVMLAGIIMNALLAYILLLILCFTGLPAAFTSDFKLPTPTTSSNKEVMVLSATPGSPAALAGLKKGNIIVSANDVPLTTDAQLKGFTKSNAGKEVKLSVRHEGVSKEVLVKLHEQGIGEKKGYLGVASMQVYNIRYGLQSFWVAASLTAQMLLLTALGIVKMLISIPLLVGGLFQPGVPVAAQSVAGPIGIFTALQNIRLLGLSYLMFFVTTISVALAVFNLLPIPVLDGGKLFLVWLQKLLRKTFSPETEAKIYMTSMAGLGILVVIISIFDIRRL